MQTMLNQLTNFMQHHVYIIAVICILLMAIVIKLALSGNSNARIIGHVINATSAVFGVIFMFIAATSIAYLQWLLVFGIMLVLTALVDIMIITVFN